MPSHPLVAADDQPEIASATTTKALAAARELRR